MKKITLLMAALTIAIVSYSQTNKEEVDLFQAAGKGVFKGGGDSDGAKAAAAVLWLGEEAQVAGAGWCAKGGQRRAVWATAPSLVLAAMEIAGGRSER